MDVPERCLSSKRGWVGAGGGFIFVGVWQYFRTHLGDGSYFCIVGRSGRMSWDVLQVQGALPWLRWEAVLCISSGKCSGAVGTLPVVS
jgi:hypothetical protein